MGSATVRSAPRRAVTAVVLILAFVIGMVPSPGAASSYEPSKIDRALLSQALAAPGADFDVIVRSAPGATRASDRAGRALERAGGKPKHALSIVGAASGRIKGALVLKLTRDADVEFVYADERLRVLDDGAGSPGIGAIGALRVGSDLHRTGKGVTIAVLDSGVAQHPDLNGRIVAAVDLVAPSSATPAGDPGGHGTHVAGLIAGDGSASSGHYLGVAPHARIVDVRVIDATGNASLSTILRGLQWVLKERTTYAIRVVNMSFGAAQTRPYTTDLLATATEILYFAGVSVVAAAGNGGPGPLTVRTPAVDPYVIAVGALDDAGTLAGTDDTIASFSSRGPTAFGGIAKPDLVAPGRRMVSLRATDSTLDRLYPDRRVSYGGGDARYFRLSGTSMATAVLSGVLALMYEADPGMTPAAARTRLLRTARPLAGYASQDQGAGMVDAYAAVSSTLAAEKPQRRPSNLFAKDTRSFLSGKPLLWYDLAFNGGVDQAGIPWTNLTWENLTWENLTWENLSWENYSWEGFSWENYSWENFSWETFTWENYSWETGGPTWPVVD